MRFILCLALLSSGCFFRKVVYDEAPDSLTGGEISLLNCGYSVVTKDGASRPLESVPMLGSDPTPWAVHLNAGRDPSTSVAIVWRTKDNDTRVSTVEYGKNGTTDQRLDGFSFYYQANGYTATKDGTVRIHEAHLCGLEPDTEYTYRVGGIGVFSKLYTFRTAPDRVKNPDAEVLILVIGDTRDGYATWEQSLKEAVKVGMPDLIMFDGDAITLGPIQEEWDAWFAKTEEIFPYVPLIYAHGNHDVNSVNFYSQFALPGDEENYSIDFGPVHIAVLNDTPLIKQDVYTKAPAFLDQDMKKAVAAPWKFTLHHKPLWSAAASAIPVDMQQRAVWQPVMDANKVDLDFAGHDHNYERTKPLRGSAPQTSPLDGTNYVVVGTAGAPLYEAGKDFWTEKSEKTHNFVFLRVRRNKVDLAAYRQDGSALDALSIIKP
jgi:acid phosphatase type 7